MAQTTSVPKSELMSTMESALDNMSEYIGEYVWGKLHEAYESVDIDVKDLEDQIEEALDRIKELEEQIERMESES